MIHFTRVIQRNPVKRQRLAGRQVWFGEGDITFYFAWHEQGFTYLAESHYFGAKVSDIAGLVKSAQLLKAPVHLQLPVYVGPLSIGAAGNAAKTYADSHWTPADPAANAWDTSLTTANCGRISNLEVDCSVSTEAHNYTLDPATGMPAGDAYCVGGVNVHQSSLYSPSTVSARDDVAPDCY
jgi:hypothetical protein